MSDIIKSNVYNFRNDIILFNIESTHYNPLKGKLCEFTAYLLDKEDLAIRDKYVSYLKLEQSDYDEAHDSVKKIHQGKWDIYLLGDKTDNWDESWKILEQDDFVPDFFEWLAPYIDEDKIGNLVSVSWDVAMSYGYFQKYVSNASDYYKEIYSKLFRENIDLKSLYRGLFMISGLSYNKSSLTETMNHFGIDDFKEGQHGNEKIELKLELFRVFCDFGIKPNK